MTRRAANERSPVHVVYGGAHLFRSDTPAKLGKLALRLLDEYAPNFVELAAALHIPGSGTLPFDADSIRTLEEDIAANPSAVRSDQVNAWIAWQVYRRTRQKLEHEPVEDFRIDFEDGYGTRSDEEEDLHASLSAAELGRAMAEGKASASVGIRIKPLNAATSGRAGRTLEIFVDALLESTGGTLPNNFVVTLSKISGPAEVKHLAKMLQKLERRHSISKGSIGIELMIETPSAIMDGSGRVVLPKLVKAAAGRCRSAHFGAFDLTASLGISARDQDIGHPACDLARQMMLLALAPLGIRLSDSVTTEMPVPIHRGDGLTSHQTRENVHAVHTAWQVHFANVVRSMSNGFYQSWDLHPGQLVPRFAAVNYYFLDGFEANARRLRKYVENAQQATLTGRAFDDAASARGLVSYFELGLACGALTVAEITEATGLDLTAIRSLFADTTR